MRQFVSYTSNIDGVNLHQDDRTSTLKGIIDEKLFCCHQVSNPGPSLQISATALEETKILVWHRDKLKLILTMSDPFLKTVLDHVVARDVVKKLTQVSCLVTLF